MVLIAILGGMRVDDHAAHRIAQSVVIRRSILSAMTMPGMTLIVPVIPL